MFSKMHCKNSTRLCFRWLTKSIETIKLCKRSFYRCYSLCFYIFMIWQTWSHQQENSATFLEFLHFYFYKFPFRSFRSFWIFMFFKYYLVWYDATAESQLQSIIKAKPQINPLNASFTKWSNTLKQFVGFCLTILWDWRLKG